jgi:hypothetical protein
LVSSGGVLISGSPTLRGSGFSCSYFKGSLCEDCCDPCVGAFLYGFEVSCWVWSWCERLEECWGRVCSSRVLGLSAVVVGGWVRLGLLAGC